MKDKDLIPGRWYALKSGSDEFFLKFNSLTKSYVNCHCYINEKRYSVGGNFSLGTYDFRDVSSKEINQHLPADKQEQIELPIFN